MARLMPIEIRTFQGNHDMRDVHDLWQESFGDSFPIDLELLFRVLTEYDSYVPGDYFVAFISGQLIGFVSTQSNHINGRIQSLVVHPLFRNNGVGSLLLRSALEHLQERGVSKVQLGGGVSRIWPGVPMILPAAKKFFESRGWHFSESSFDLVLDLKNYETPQWVYQRIQENGIELSVGNRLDAADVLEFESSEHPNWINAFKFVLNNQDYNDVLIAREGKEIVGTLLMFSKASHCPSSNFVWRRILGSDMGGIGVVGVKKSEYGKGIGMAMVATAAEILKERGVGNCTACWTWLVDWYGKLGFKQWHKYQMSWMEFDNINN